MANEHDPEALVLYIELYGVGASRPYMILASDAEWLREHIRTRDEADNRDRTLSCGRQ